MRSPITESPKGLEVRGMTLEILFDSIVMKGKGPGKVSKPIIDYARQAAKAKSTNPKAGFLDDTDMRTARFFGGGERERLRLAFFD